MGLAESCPSATEAMFARLNIDISTTQQEQNIISTMNVYITDDDDDDNDSDTDDEIIEKIKKEIDEVTKDTLIILLCIGWLFAFICSCLCLRERHKRNKLAKNNNYFGLHDV